MHVSTSHTPICAPRRPRPEEAYFFMMNCLLYSRMEAGFPSNHEYFDEDVNVYLAGLLTSIVYPHSRALSSSCVASSDAALFEQVCAARSPREKYLLYRDSADRMLLSLGIFRNARLRRPDSKPRLPLTERGCIGRGKTYYALARSYAAQAHRANTGVGEVLGKLSHGFERYLSVLSVMSGEHLNFFRPISDGEIFHLENASRSFERSAELKLLRDRFLDLYSSYLRRKSPRTKQELVAAAGEIRSIDPSFSFDIEKRERVSSP